MTEKQKAQKVWARRIVNKIGFLRRRNGHDDLPSDLAEKEVEVAVFVEPEMIQPEGVRWVTVYIPSSITDGDSFLQLGDGSKLLIANVYFLDPDKCYYWWCEGSYGHEKTIELAQKAAKKVLADARLHGFGWETSQGENEND